MNHVPVSMFKVSETLREDVTDQIIISRVIRQLKTVGRTASIQYTGPHSICHTQDFKHCTDRSSILIPKSTIHALHGMEYQQRKFHPLNMFGCNFWHSSAKIRFSHAIFVCNIVNGTRKYEDSTEYCWFCVSCSPSHKSYRMLDEHRHMPWCHCLSPLLMAACLFSFQIKSPILPIHNT